MLDVHTLLDVPFCTRMFQSITKKKIYALRSLNLRLGTDWKLSHAQSHPKTMYDSGRNDYLQRKLEAILRLPGW